MKIPRKRVMIAGGILLTLAATLVLIYGFRLAALGTAYTAKTLCSGVFVALRAPDSLLEADLAADDLSLMQIFDVQIDRESRKVTASLFGLVERTAIYRDGCGCAVGRAENAKPAPGSGENPHRLEQPTLMDDLKPVEPLPPDIDQNRMNAALDLAFSEPDPDHLRRTRAVVVLHKGQLVAERYADGFTKETPLIGWSMTKSVVNAFVGILVRQRRIDISDSVPIRDWQAPSDARKAITWEHLLHMSSGLEFQEDYSNPLADVTYMLLGTQDVAGYAAAKPLEVEPGTRWSYTSGTTNIISAAIKNVVGEADYLEFPRRALFDRIGMTSAVLETDAAGTFVGSSFMYATARDWARFGLLYLNDGMWSGERILPEGWVTFTRTPAPHAPQKQYGAHFWLHVPAEYSGEDESPQPPADTFHAVGQEGQFVTIIPSRELVIVRLGLTRYPSAWDHEAFLQLVLAAFADGVRR